MATSFIPKFSSSTSLSVTTSSGSTNANLEESCPQVRLYNSGSVSVFVRWGTSDQTAVTTDMAIGPGATEVFTKQNATKIAAITASGSATLYIISGTGD